MFGKIQFSTDNLVVDLWFFVAAIMVIAAIAGLTLIDGGAVRVGNRLDNAVQKFGASIACGFGMLVVGYPIWYWQFNQAFGVDRPLSTAMKDWWFGGDMLRTVSTELNPAVVNQLDLNQIFVVFFVTFGMLVGALMHSALIEKVKPLPLIITALIFGTVIEPFLSYLLWGSASPFTNRGFHDYIAVSSVYLAVGSFTLAMNIFVRPRLGRFEPHPSGAAPIGSDPAAFAVGVLLMMLAIPFIVIGSGFIIPGQGYYSITFASTGIGVVGINLVTAFIGGGVMGLIIAYVRREPFWALFGPIAGYVICGALLDVGDQTECFVLALFGPILMVCGHLLLERLRIDDPKVGPLALFPGTVGLVATGFIAWHTRQGGFPGLTGKYAFQSAEITPWMQVVGTLVALGVGFGSGVVISFVLKKTIGLRISEEAEIGGMDEAYWGGNDKSDEAITETADHKVSHIVDEDDHEQLPAGSNS